MMGATTSLNRIEKICIVNGKYLKLAYYVNNRGLCVDLQSSVTRVLSIMYDIEKATFAQPSYITKLEILLNIERIYKEISICITYKDLQELTKSMLMADTTYNDFVYTMWGIRNRMISKYIRMIAT